MYKEAAKVKLVGKAKAAARKKAKARPSAPKSAKPVSVAAKPVSVAAKPKAGMKIPKPIKVGLVGAGLAGVSALAAKIRKANSEQS